MRSSGAAASPGKRMISSGGAALLVVVVVLIVASVQAAGAGATGAGASATANRAFTVYSVATGVQYINTEDDRVRGRANNPLDDSAKKLHPGATTKGRGPFAGDVAIYALTLYKDTALKRTAGSAVYTCYFNYDQHAFCKAYFKLRRAGTLVASGPIDFKASKFGIVVTGGTNQYLGVRGQLEAAAGQSHSKVDFRLIG